MVSHPETGSDSPIGSDRDRGRDKCVFQKKKKRKRKKEKQSQRFALKPEHCSKGLWRKPLKPGALSQLVGSHRLSVHYTGGWVEFSKL